MGASRLIDVDVGIDEAGKNGVESVVVEDRVGGNFRDIADGAEILTFNEKRSGTRAGWSNDAVGDKGVCHNRIISRLDDPEFARRTMS